MSVAAATMMARRAAHFDHAAKRPLLRGICLVVKGPQPPGKRPTSPSAAKTPKIPQRPNPQALSESIPLFFVARNDNGFWVVREAEGRSGGIFLFKRSAVRFAENNSAPVGCATMFPTEQLELDVKNQGGTIAGWLDAILRMARQKQNRTYGPSGLGAKHP